MLEKALSYNNWIPYQRLNWLELLPYALRMMQRTNVNTHSTLCIPKLKKKKKKTKNIDHIKMNITRFAVSWVE